jgi:hypothetical protein
VDDVERVVMIVPAAEDKANCLNEIRNFLFAPGGTVMVRNSPVYSQTFGFVVTNRAEEPVENIGVLSMIASEVDDSAVAECSGLIVVGFAQFE